MPQVVDAKAAFRSDQRTTGRVREDLAGTCRRIAAHVVAGQTAANSGSGVAEDSGVPFSYGEMREVAMVVQWIKSLVRRLRIALYRRREVEREIQDERRAEHVDRVREGIKDTPPFMGPPVA